MSNESSERAQKILELRARFPEADVEIIEEALAHSRFDVCTAAGMLIGFGCKLASRGPTSVSTKPSHLSSAPHAPVALASGPPCPSARDAVQPPRRHDLAPSASANEAVQLPAARHNRSSVFDDFKPDYVERALGDAKGAEVEALEILLALGDSALACRSTAPSSRAYVPQHSASSADRTDLLVSRKQSPSLPPAHPGETLTRATADPALQQHHSRVVLGHDQAAHSTSTVHLSGNADISVPLAMLSTAHQIQQAQMESRALFEQEMRSKKIHVFVDLSNVSIGAQVGPDGKRDMNMKINVPELVQCVHQGRDVKGRFVITSIAGTLEANRQPAFIRDWEKAGYVVRVQERRGGSEQMLDEVLISSMQQTILRFGASKLGAGPGQKQHTLVLLSGDGNTNHDHHSFAETIQLALSDGMFVEIWAWKNSVSKVYTKSFMEHYGGSFSVRYFDDHRDRILSARFLAATADFSVQHDNDDDDDWMFCPITFQAIEDAAATKFAPKRYYERCSLEAWVRGHGCCPLTRKSCTMQDIVSCAHEMRARLKMHAQRPSKSPPPQVPLRLGGVAVVDASLNTNVIKIPINKIRTLIGPGGSTIKGIRSKTGADIHVDDDGSVHIRSCDADVVHRAREMIADLTLKEIQVGETYQAAVVSIKEFGCFVEVPFGKQGLVHISELADTRERIKAEDVVKVGDVICVKCIAVDESGRARLSRKAVLKERGGGPAS